MLQTWFSHSSRSESPGGLVAADGWAPLLEFLVWGKAGTFALFLTSCPVKLMLLVWGPHSRKAVSEQTAGGGRSSRRRQGGALFSEGCVCSLQEHPEGLASGDAANPCCFFLHRWF